MEKRQNRMAFIFSILFILTLTLAAGSYLLGLKTGISMAEADYEAEKEGDAQAAGTSPASQQDIAVFYNNVFVPYREFQAEWDKVADSLAQGSLGDAKAEFARLAKLASVKYDEAGSVSLQHVKLVGASQAAYLRSLKLFKDAADDAAAAAKKSNNAELDAAIAANANYKSAVKQQLQGQRLFYGSMLQWSASVDSAIPAEYAYNAGMKLSVWSGLPLVVKNKLAADALQSKNGLTDYLPQDLTARVDEMIASGQAGKRGLATIGAVIDLLTETKSVRSGDYGAGQQYRDELLPDIPLF
ncbi:hypothetical protein ACFSL6_16770 [Paenibacillus thailandensis]|uniref:Uncharacterized protein n=1 Tax=Paenibacillus thailandensis TaxID=393250 RepID=A0ABW5QZU0_9BACL